jgi:hypothetical protein
MPTLLRCAHLSFIKAANEHGMLSTSDTEALSLGDQLMLMPG